MANIHTRGGHARLLQPDLYRVYKEAGKERPREYPLILNVTDMPWNPVTDAQVSGLGQTPSKPEGSQFTLDRIVMGGTKSYEAVPYGTAIEITYEMFRDELYGIMRELSAELGRSGRNREEVEAWSIFNNAFSTSFTGFTSGEALCSTSHTSFADGTTRANRPSPEISFSVTGLQNAIVRYESLTNERSMPQVMAPSQVIIAPRNKFAAREILGSSGKPYTADNEINALIEEDLRWFVAHYLTTTTNWFLCASKGVHDLWFLWRDHPMFDSFDDPWTKNAVYTNYQRHISGYGSWRGVDGSTG